MNNEISAVLESLPENHILWADAKNQYSSVDIIKISNLINSKLELSGAVALFVNNPLYLATLITAFEGVLSRVALIHYTRNLNISEFSDLVKKAKAKNILTDDTESITDLNLDDVIIYDINNWFDINSIREEIQPVNVIEPKYDTEWIIPTSGTTDTPKLVVHTFSSLTRSTKRNIDKGKELRWGMLYQLSRFAGLQVYFQSLTSGSKLIFIDLNNIEVAIDSLIKESCNALSATPTMYRKLLMSKSIASLNLVQITLGGEIVDQKILNSLSYLFPKARINHIYASTEAGVGFSVSDKLAGFPIEYTFQKIKGVDIKVSSEELLHLRSDSMTKNIINSDSSKLTDFEGYINTGDRVQKVDNRYIFLGRENGSINVGGNKVFPEEVENVLLELPFVEFAHVKGKSNPLVGQLVCAEVVITSSENQNYNDLNLKIVNHCKERLDLFKVPAVIKFVDKLKINKSGKIERK